MRRREFKTLLGGAATASALSLSPLRAQTATPVIGFLGSATFEQSASNLAGFHQGLRDVDFVEGRNLSIEYRWAEGRFDRMAALVADLVARKVDLIVAGADPAAQAAKNATSTIPIVFIAGADPVAQSLVATLARPGGNLTGVSFQIIELNPKRFELLRELVPHARTIALLVNPNNPAVEQVVKDVEEAARGRQVQLQVLQASTEIEIDAAFASLVQRQAGGLLFASDPFLGSRRAKIMALAARHAVPAIYEFREYVMGGGLASYGTSFRSIFRQVGNYAGRILRGAAPADLPVVQPTVFELVINLKVAKALGITVPPSLLLRADELIE